MYDYEEPEIRRMLIETCYSSKMTEQYFLDRLSEADLLALLVKIAVDEEGYLGDAPMAAAHFVAQFPKEMLGPYEPTLFNLFPEADDSGYGASVAIALAKTGSRRGRQLIIEQLGDKSRNDARFFQQALAEYEEDTM